MKNLKITRALAGSNIHWIFALSAFCAISLICSSNISALMETERPSNFAGGKLTLKEKIDQAKSVKVYFVNHGIVHSPNTKPVGTQKYGTGCPKFDESTELPEGYTSASKKIVQLLNEGFKTSAFAEGDIKSVPVKKTLNIENPDWLKHGEALVAFVTFSGTYKVDNMGLMGEVKLQNSMTVTAYLQFYEIVDGKLQVIVNKYLANVASKTKSTTNCDTYDYFVENFPANSLVESFNSTVQEKVAGFTEKQMKKYEKAMKKKK